MSYLNHDEITDLIHAGGEVTNALDENIGAASLDVRLGTTILVESRPEGYGPLVVDYRRRQKLEMREMTLDSSGFMLSPGDFILAHTMEVCNFADDTAALFRIKSSMGRIGLEHMDAGWVDPGFRGVLTLEFANMTRYHSILIRPGDPIGQLVFFKGTKVDPEHSYRTRGNYNDATSATQTGFKR